MTIDAKASRPFIDPQMIARAMRDEAMFDALNERINALCEGIQSHQDERTAWLIRAGDDARRANLRSKFDERGW